MSIEHPRSTQGAEEVFPDDYWKLVDLAAQAARWDVLTADDPTDRSRDIDDSVIVRYGDSSDAGEAGTNLSRISPLSSSNKLG